MASEMNTRCAMARLDSPVASSSSSSTSRRVSAVPGLVIRVHQQRGHFGRQRAVACGGGKHRLPDLLRRRVLEHVAAGACLDGRKDVGVGVVRGEDQDGRGRVKAPDQPGGGNTVHPRAHLEVHQDQVHRLAQDLAALQFVEGGLPVRGFGCHQDALEIGEHGAQPGPDHGVVVHQQHPDDGHGAPVPGNGSRMATTVPSPGADCSSRVPCSAVTRVRQGTQAKAAPVRCGRAPPRPVLRGRSRCRRRKYPT